MVTSIRQYDNGGHQEQQQDIMSRFLMLQELQWVILETKNRCV
ncbi:hypothetical protein AVDCRST_MAG94-4901 [uncultured Leptolyngbya sp.]|uniref:Uncharacterized protein n=1 Tax=uncultured Leptolyngbya sp. TaxID=332963 RepID=A0A6J4N8V7_9CYAN|nr:hypothetical protein AVDCRST_MAG94-4901 [uncultured Leptolyngbya sp.]